MQNKVLNKYLLPYYIGSVFFVALGGGATKLLFKESKIAQVMYSEKPSFANSNTNHFLCVILIIVSAIMGWFGLIGLPRSSKERANKMTRKYLRNVFSKNPELKQYESVLNNPQTLQQICAVACNDLDKDEQKQILSIVNHALNKEPKSDFEEKENIANMEMAIFDIVNEHIKTHPIYMTTLIVAIKNAHKTYVMSANTKSR